MFLRASFMPFPSFAPIAFQSNPKSPVQAINPLMAQNHKLLPTVYSPLPTVHYLLN